MLYRHPHMNKSEHTFGQKAALSQTSEALINVMAGIDAPMTATNISKAGLAAGIKGDTGRKLKKGEMDACLKEIDTNHALVDDGEDRVSLPSPFADALCTRLASEGQFAELAPSLLKFLNKDGQALLSDVELVQARTRIHYFVGDKEAFASRVKDLLTHWDDGKAVNGLFLLESFSPPMLDALDDQSLNQLCLLLHNHVLHFLGNQAPFFEYLSKRLGRIPVASEILALFRYLRGEEIDPQLRTFAIGKAFVALDKGNFVKSQEEFLRAHQDLHGPGGAAGVLFLPSMAGLIAAMVFSATGEADGFEKAMKICQRASRDGHRAARYFNTFERFLQVHSGTSKVDFDFFFPEPEKFTPVYALQTFVATLWTKWLDNPLPPAELLQVVQDYSRDEGYMRLQAEYDRFLYGSSDFFDGSDHVSIQELLHRKQEWELKLGQLERLATTNTKKAPSESGEHTRVIWEIIQPYRDQFELQPVLQKLTKTGYSKGRKISLGKLVNPEDWPTHLADRDEQILGKIKRSKDYWYGSTPHYVLDDSAWLDAVGHPDIYWQGDRMQPVEIVKRSIQLSIDKDGEGSYAIKLKGDYPADEDFHLNRVSQYLLEITELTSQHRVLIELLGKPLVVPAGNKLRLSELAGRLATMAMIDSEEEDMLTFSAQVDGDTTPIIHLTPIADALRVQFFVQPFGREVGPVFTPGQGGKNVMAMIDGEQSLVKRDLEAECAAAHVVLDDCSITIARASSNEYRFTTPDAEESLELLLNLHQSEHPMMVKWPKGGAVKMRGEISADSAALRIGSEQDWFELSGEVAVDEDLVVELKELMKLSGDLDSRFVKMSDGSFVALTDHFRQHLQNVNRVAEVEGDTVRVPNLAQTAMEEFAGEFDDLIVDAGWTRQLQRVRELKDVNPEIPSSFNADLRPYQKEGFEWLARLAHWGVGACLADDMGLGKTVQALALLIEKSAKGPSLVVAPTSVCSNWVDEAEKFAPGLTCHLLQERDRSAGFADLGPGDLLITSYGLLVNELDELKHVDFQIAVVDEAQAIKNPSTRRSKAVREINAGFKIAMTGTPIENHLGELWAIFRFINPGLLGTLQKFNGRFANPIEKERNPLPLEQLRKLIRPFVLRRHKSEILKELPPKTEIELTITPSPEERAFYESLRQNAMEKLAAASGDAKDDNEPAGNRMQILAEIMRLRRACCNPALIEEGIDLPSSKLDRLMFLTDELIANEHQALIFSQFVGHLKLIREALDEKGISYAYLDGSTPAKERKKQIAAFQAGEHDLFLISLKAGGTGLNLTAADYVIHMDPWWNPAVEDQASDRAHRIGQERPVTIYRLIIQDSIESKIMTLHESKRQLAEDLLTGAEMGSRLSADDLLNLIRDI